MTPEQIKQEYGEYLDKWNVFEYEDQIRVSLIVIKPEHRGQGVGKAIFQELVNYADKVNKTIVLTPTDEWGMNKAKLINFYKAFDFVINKGKNKNYEYSELMYREPKTNIGENVMDKKRFQKLAGIVKENVTTYEQLEQWEDMPPEALEKKDKVEVEGPSSEDTSSLLMLFSKYPSWLRAIHLWFHGAHHSTRGTGFAGDHANLYTRIYTEVQDEVDGAVEKLVGLYDDEKLACPLCVTKKAYELMSQYPSPMELEAHRIPVVGLQMIKDYLLYLEELKCALEEAGQLTMGLEDQLPASANVHEVYVYLLQQRAKVGR